MQSRLVEIDSACNGALWLRLGVALNHPITRSPDHPIFRPDGGVNASLAQQGLAQREAEFG
jgi:hypothetical protein